MPRIKEIGNRPNPSRPTREAAELAIGVATRNYVNSPFTALFNQGSVIVDYYAIDENETTYTETLNLTQNYHKTVRFIKIENFVIFGRGDDQELDDKGPNFERALQLNLTPKQSIVQAETLKPKENDHIVIKSQLGLSKPFRVTNVLPGKVIDRDAFRIDYQETTMFTIDELEERVTKRLAFDSSKLGTNQSSIVDAKTMASNSEIEATIDNIQKQFVDTFYNVQYDILGFSPSFGDMGALTKYANAHIYMHDQFIFNHYANDLMQQTHQVLKFGYDRNTLFLTNTYKYDKEIVNYRTSIYETLLRRKFTLRENLQLDGTEQLVTTEEAQVLDFALDVRDVINDTYGIDYTSKYVYAMKYYLRPHTDHLILTHIFNTGITLVDMINSINFISPVLASTYVTYEIKHPILTQFFDKFMDNDYDWIRSNMSLLEEYYVDKDNIDDYMGAPLLLLVLEKVYADNNKKDNVSSWLKGVVRK